MHSGPPTWHKTPRYHPQDRELQFLILSLTRGTSYISWFTPGTGGNYFPWIQKLDVGRNLQWPGGGKLVSTHTSMTWITDYSLAISPDTGVFIAFQDMRDVTNDIFIYKLSPSGTFLWGNDGVQLSSNADFEVNPVMAVHPDGSVVRGMAACAEYRRCYRDPSTAQ